MIDLDGCVRVCMETHGDRKRGSSIIKLHWHPLGEFEELNGGRVCLHCIKFLQNYAVGYIAYFFVSVQ